MRPAEAQVVTPGLLRSWAPDEPDDGGDKHSRGTIAVVGGGTSTPGAVLLAGLGALRAGAGRLQVLTVETTSVALAIALPEAMVSGLPADAHGSLSPGTADDVCGALGGAHAVVLGPGLSGDGVPALLEGVLAQLSDDVRLVLDANALTALAGRPELLGSRAASRTVLTPNAGELAALLGGERDDERSACTEVAQRYGAVVSGRGWVVHPDGRTWREEAGGIGLGTSGSGDVLAGLVGGMLARGAEPAQAAVWGQYLHAAAGDRLSAHLGRLGFLAREVLDEVPHVLAALRT